MKLVASLLSLTLAVTALSGASIQRIYLVHFSHTDFGFTDLRCVFCVLLAVMTCLAGWKPRVAGRGARRGAGAIPALPTARTE